MFKEDGTGFLTGTQSTAHLCGPLCCCQRTDEGLVAAAGPWWWWWWTPAIHGIDALADAGGLQPVAIATSQAPVHIHCKQARRDIAWQMSSISGQHVHKKLRYALWARWWRRAYALACAAVAPPITAEPVAGAAPTLHAAVAGSHSGLRLADHHHHFQTRQSHVVTACYRASPLTRMLQHSPCVQSFQPEEQRRHACNPTANAAARPALSSQRIQTCTPH